MRMRMSACVQSIPVLLVLLLTASPAAAQATRTWVSGVGDDVNPCSRTAPCKTFAGAISKTAAEGEIDALDPGGFGAVTITKSITIDGGGTLAGILGAGTNGINVNDSATATPGTILVTLRNLSINGAGSGVQGIRVVSGRNVLIEHCEIFGFDQNGIDFQPNNAMSMTVTDTSIHHNLGAGIFTKPSGAFFARLTANGVRMDRNGNGILVQDNSLVFVTNSSAAHNTTHGFFAQSTFGGPAQLDIENSSTSNNGNAGVVSANSGAVATISNVAVDHNGGAGVVPLSGGQILTANNNRVNGNGGGTGSTTGTLTIM